MSQLPVEAAPETSAPKLIIDAGLYERLESLAVGALDHSEDVAQRLLDELARAEVRPADSIPPGVITLGSEVTYRDETSGRTQTVQLVLPGDADISRRRISVLTPIGTALIGLSEGQCIDWETRDGSERQLTVVSVQPGGAD
ncbi:nucleoside diphosphate kinase regulator [Aquibaculum sediminis]|uniref:nucleoside diphosphate kinase regulator n=1 Tax=Aquibaculum sediminis TaxID=3231907 RepID=UPI0034551C5E